MQLKTILNRVTRYKSFVFGKVTWLEDSVVSAVEGIGSFSSELGQSV